MSDVLSVLSASPAHKYREFTSDIAGQIEGFLIAVKEIARGNEPETALPLLLLQVSQLALAGGRLGAIADVVPYSRFEPDPGPDPDVDELRERLATLLEPVDEYMEIIDPVDPAHGAGEFRLSDDLASIASDLLHGLVHYRAGRTVEALWWWQFSYLSSWGTTSATVLRALHSLIAHARFMPADPAS
ncbi:MAG TPA: DUF5063 domain-containing protein [Jiangellaceae bacterium]